MRAARIEGLGNALSSLLASYHIRFWSKSDGRKLQRYGGGGGKACGGVGGTEIYCSHVTRCIGKVDSAAYPAQSLHHPPRPVPTPLFQPSPYATITAQFLHHSPNPVPTHQSQSRHHSPNQVLHHSPSSVSTPLSQPPSPYTTPPAKSLASPPTQSLHNNHSPVPTPPSQPSLYTTVTAQPLHHSRNLVLRSPSPLPTQLSQPPSPCNTPPSQSPRHSPRPVRRR